MLAGGYSSTCEPLPFVILSVAKNQSGQVLNTCFSPFANIVAAHEHHTWVSDSSPSAQNDKGEGFAWVGGHSGAGEARGNVLARSEIRRFAQDDTGEWGMKGLVGSLTKRAALCGRPTILLLLWRWQVRTLKSSNLPTH